MQPNKPDRPNRPNEQDRLADFFSILVDEAQAKGWTVVSMKDDWQTIFPPETK